MTNYRTRMVMGSSGTVSYASTVYCQLGSGGALFETTEAYTQILIRASLTIRNLYLSLNSNSINGTSTCRSRKDGANGNLSVSIPSSTSGIFEDTSDSDSVASGDYANYQFVTGGNSGTLAVYSLSITLDSSTGPTRPYILTTSSTENLSGFTTSIVLNGNLRSTFYSESNVFMLMRCAGTLSHLACYVVGNTETSASTLKFRKNAANGNSNLSITASTTGWFEDSSDTDTVASGDQVDYQSSVGSATLYVSTVEILFVGSGVTSILLNGQTYSIGDATTRYVPMDGTGPNSGGEAVRTTMRLGNYGGMLHNLFANVSANTLNSGTSTIRVRKNEANGNESVSITYGTTGQFEDTSDTDSFVTTDQFDYAITNAGTSGTLTTIVIATHVDSSDVTVSGTVGLSVSGAVVVSQVVRGTVGLTISGAVKISQKVAGTVGIAVAGTAKITKQVVAGTVGIAVSGAVKIMKQVVNGTVGIAIVGSVFAGFQGLIGHAAALLKGHLLGETVKQHDAAGSVKKEQPGGYEA